MKKIINDNSLEYELKGEPLIEGNYCPVYKYHLRYQLPEGKWSDWHDRECVHRLDAIAVLPVDPVSSNLVLLEQFRIGAATGKSNNPWLLEMVAGLIEPHETVIDAAMRETEEETGLIVKKLLPICQYFVSPGYTNEQVFLFVGIVDLAELPVKTGNTPENEYIYPKVFSFEAAFQKLNHGLIRNSFTILALQFLQLHMRNHKLDI